MVFSMTRDQDVAETIKVIANKAPAGYDWSFVSGGSLPFPRLFTPASHI
jgi:hypothetical protein